MSRCLVSPHLSRAGCGQSANYPVAPNNCAVSIERGWEVSLQNWTAMKSGQKKCTRICVEIKSWKPFWKKHPQYTRPGSSPDLLVIGSQVYCETNVHAATEAVPTSQLFSCGSVKVSRGRNAQAIHGSMLSRANLGRSALVD
ncbi:unnamed protein product [Timema podura]|uniref:Uncharacterized protein n=1 Tax=Timema podura TaxID=61482 RepID=A0ABN7NN37_TIMPD|nr:unnamed protein product [Timema podura]